MEVGPGTFTAELAAQPDLFEAYADQEVTIFGIHGTVRDLAGMCPVDLQNPAVTLEAKNEFIVKAANEAGLEIKPEHETVFSDITERYGLQRNYTVAEKPPTRPVSQTSEKLHKAASTEAEVEQEFIAVRLSNTAEEDREASRRTVREAKIVQRRPNESIDLESRVTEEYRARTMPASLIETVSAMGHIIAKNLDQSSPSHFEHLTQAPASREKAVIPTAYKMERRLSKKSAPLLEVVAARPQPERVSASLQVALPATRPELFIRPARELVETDIDDAVADDEQDDQALLHNLVSMSPEPAAGGILEGLLEAPEAEVMALLADIEDSSPISFQNDFEANPLQQTNSLEAGENFQLTETPVIEGQTPIALHEITEPLERIEMVIAALVEVVGNGEERGDGRAQAIIAEIINLPESIPILAADEGNNELIDIKLAELVEDLFEEIDIPPSPELVQTFIKLITAHYLEEKLTSVQEDNEEMPDESGTREFLQKLQQGVRNMKKSALHLYEIGKSALRLYNLRPHPLVVKLLQINPA